MNDVCYVIGGGPSLTGFDFDALPGGYRIGANKVGWLAKCDALVTVDRNFHRNFREQLLAFPGAVYVAIDGQRETLPNVTYWTHRRDEGFAMKPGYLCGSNSGYAALNLAFLLGYKEIALLGFDFMWDEDRSHFHDGYARQTRNVDRQLGNWVRSFKTAAAQLTTAGVSVTNFIGPKGSRLAVFPNAPLGDLL